MAAMNRRLVQARRTAASAVRPRPWLLPRRFHAYGVGTAKSGTSSLAAMFSEHYRSAHEPDPQPLFAHAAAIVRDDWATATFPVRRRDRKLRLEMDSSQLNFIVLTELVREFPDAKFVLTMRDCFGWLDSFVNHQLSHPVDASWRQFRELRFRADELSHPAEERALEERGLYTLEGYLSYWAQHNQAALRILPPGRRLVVKTGDITSAVPAIARFLSIPVGTLAADKAHANRARASFNVLDEVPERHLVETARRTCGAVMEEYFPNECRWQ